MGRVASHPHPVGFAKVSCRNIPVALRLLNDLPMAHSHAVN